MSGSCVKLSPCHSWPYDTDDEHEDYGKQRSQAILAKHVLSGLQALGSEQDEIFDIIDESGHKHELPCNSVLLRIASPYFRCLLSGPFAKRNSAGRFEIKGCDPSDIMAVQEFFLQGQVMAPKSRLSSLFHFADQFQVQGLRTAVADAIEKQLRAYSWQRQAEALDVETTQLALAVFRDFDVGVMKGHRLREAAASFLQRHFIKLLKSAESSTLGAECDLKAVLLSVEPMMGDSPYSWVALPERRSVQTDG